MPPAGPRKLFKGVTTATSGVLARFPLLLPVRNSFASYGASVVTRTSDRGHVAEAINQGHRSGGVPIRVSKEILLPLNVCVFNGAACLMERLSFKFGVCVFITAGPITNLCAWGRRIVEDMCYEMFSKMTPKNVFENWYPSVFFGIRTRKNPLPQGK